MSAPPLPIDELLPEIARILLSSTTQALCIEAPPGAGKTTRLPPYLLSHFAEGEIVVLEPRRLAAHLSAARVAAERGEQLGETVGVQMRFHSICGPSTRLRYVTEGVLLRQLQSDPTLGAVKVVVLDEFHERHLASDLALALLWRLCAPGGPRPDLKLCVMSATLNGDQISAFLQNCPIVRSSGRSHPVDIGYDTSLLDEPLWKRVRGAVRQLLRDGCGDILVFLPGSAEIRRCAEALEELETQADLEVLPLHGDLPFFAQQRAVAPRAKDGRRKVILATNVAETSLTIDGVTAVIDSGLAKVAGQRPYSGLPLLRVQAISRAQAAQRAGRAGRTGPGRCLRLYSKLDHDARPEFETPEILRLDLCEFLLTLYAAKLHPANLAFLSPPSAAALQGAQNLLERLGALDENAHLTPLGRRLSTLAIHPRLGRLLLAAAEAGRLEEGATLAALLSERDLRLSRAGLGDGESNLAKVHGPSDLLHLLDLFEEAKAARFSRPSLQRMGIDADVAQSVERARKQLVGAAQRTGFMAAPAVAKFALENCHPNDAALLQAILCAYPDRVARRRQKTVGQSPEFVLAGGGSAVLVPSSVVREFDLVVLVDTEEQSTQGLKTAASGRTWARLISAISADWLLDLPGAKNALHETSEALWNFETQRVEVVRRLQYEQLVLDESRQKGDGSDAAQHSLLFRQAMATELRIFADGSAWPEFLARLHLAAAHHAKFQEIGCDAPAVEQLVRQLCQGRSSLVELAELSLVDAFWAQHPSSLRAELGRLVPEFLTLLQGRRVRVHYELDKPPWLASRLQDFFAMQQGPRVLDGRVAVVLHLLAPNQRAVQVTTDLAGFWTRHYPAIRRELCRRYPRHAWPESPV